jgi:hypothetical protein
MACIVAVTFASLMPSLTNAHGVVGNRTFLSPIVGNDAFPDNSLDLTTRRSDYEFSLLPGLEKLLSDNSSLLIVGGWDRVSPSPPQAKTSGASDVTIYYRQGFFISVEHEMEFTLSPFVILPAGDRKVGDQGYTHLGGELLLGKGLGDLPKLMDVQNFSSLRHASRGWLRRASSGAGEQRCLRQSRIRVLAQLPGPIR